MMQLRNNKSNLFQTLFILSIFVGLFSRGKTAQEIRRESVSEKHHESDTDRLLAELEEKLGEGASFVPYRYRKYHDIAASLMLDHAMHVSKFDPHTMSDANANQQFKKLTATIRKMPGVTVIDSDHRTAEHNEKDYGKLSGIITEILGNLPSTELDKLIMSLKSVAKATITSQKNAQQTRSKVGTFITKEGDKVEVLVHFMRYSIDHKSGWITDDNKVKLDIYYIRYSILSEQLILNQKAFAELDKHKTRNWENIVKEGRSEL